MVRLMELNTSLETPDVVKLRNLEKWNKETISFPEKTTQCSGATLQELHGLHILRS